MSAGEGLPPGAGALPPEVMAALLRELGAARDGRRAWPRLQVDILSRLLDPHGSAILSAVAGAWGVPGRLMPGGKVRLEVTRGGRIERGGFSPTSGEWTLGDHRGFGPLTFAQRAWSPPAAVLPIEATAERMSCLLGRALVATTVGR